MYRVRADLCWLQVQRWSPGVLCVGSKDCGRCRGGLLFLLCVAPRILAGAEVVCGSAGVWLQGFWQEQTWFVVLLWYGSKDFGRCRGGLRFLLCGGSNNFGRCRVGFNYQLPNGPIRAGRRWGQRHPQGANLGSNGVLKLLSKTHTMAATSPP